MSKNTTIAAVVLAVIGSGAMAQGITGGSIGVEVTQPTDFEDFVGTNYFGSIEYGINRQFAVSADISSFRFDSLDEDASSFTVHGVYHIGDTASVGAFLGQDQSSQTGDLAIYGLEGGTEFMGGEVEGYIGVADNDANTLMFGVDGVYSFSETIAFTGAASFLDSGDEGSASKVSLGAEYMITGGPSLYAEVGSANIDVAGNDNSETFVGLGAKIDFGAARGTTFGQRSLFDSLPTFGNGNVLSVVSD